MSFYMPTGEEVSFCAHAAMGGAMIMATTKGANANQADSLQFTATMQPDQTYESIIHDHDIVSLRITQAPYIEEKMRHPPQLQRILRDALSIQGPELVQPPSIMSSRRSIRYPTFCNASIARPKTLVYLSSVETLNKTQAPPVSDSFRLACDAIQSTGLYLYAPCTSNADDDDDDDTLDDCVEFECRQFPRASGYSEDPATGIAAAALAVSLHTRGLQVPYYKFHQGTSMGKPSLIMVEDLQVRDIDDAKHVSFLLTGKVEVDSRETIEIFEDE
jgi:predicted PhzF superfamily epimerase YddE/YHI9